MLAEYDDANRVTRVYDENNLTETRNDYDALGNAPSWTGGNTKQRPDVCSKQYS